MREYAQNFWRLVSKYYQASKVNVNCPLWFQHVSLCNHIQNAMFSHGIVEDRPSCNFLKAFTHCEFLDNTHVPNVSPGGYTTTFTSFEHENMP